MAKMLIESTNKNSIKLAENLNYKKETKWDFYTLLPKKNITSNDVKFASDENKQYFSQKQDNSSFIEVQKLRQTAIENAALGQFQVNANYWFEQSTDRIIVIKQIEDKLTD